MFSLRFSVLGILAQIGIIIIVIFAQFSLVEIENNLKPSKMVKLDPKTLTVGIIGYTGESGKALAKEILSRDLFKSTTLIGRRIVNDNEIFKNGTQVVVDFDNLENNSDAFKQDVIYCCLGTTRGKSGADGFRKVDYDYVVNSAKIAKQNGCKQFHLVSSAGADKNALLLYPKTKGESEEAISQLGFDKVSIYRPKMLVVEGGRVENRLMERFALTLTAPFKYIAPQLIHTPIEKLAKSMVRQTLCYNEENKVELIDNAKIFDLADKFDKNAD